MTGPEISKRNADKLFPNNETRTPKRTKTKKSTLEDDKGLMMVSDIISQYTTSPALRLLQMLKPVKNQSATHKLSFFKPNWKT